MTDSLESLIQCPRARGEVDDLVVQEVYDELVVYDLRRHRVHSLNATASLVWHWCDGQTPPEQVAQRLAGHLDIPQPQAEPLVWLSLDRLGQAHLLRDTPAPPAGQSLMSRRQAMKVIGVAALLPVVYSIVAPTAANALSLGGEGYPCTSNSQCQSGCCKKTDNLCGKFGSGACLDT